MLSGGYLFDTYDADLIQSVLDRLTPQSARYTYWNFHSIVSSGGMGMVQQLTCLETSYLLL